MDTHLPKEVTRGHPDQMPEPPQVAPLNTEEQQLYFEDLTHLQQRKGGWWLYLQPCSSNLAA